MADLSLQERREAYFPKAVKKWLGEDAVEFSTLSDMALVKVAGEFIALDLSDCRTALHRVHKVVGLLLEAV